PGRASRNDNPANWGFTKRTRHPSAPRPYNLAFTRRERNERSGASPSYPVGREPHAAVSRGEQGEEPHATRLLPARRQPPANRHRHRPQHGPAQQPHPET